MTQRYMLLAGLVFSALTLVGASNRSTIDTDNPPSSLSQLPAPGPISAAKPERVQLAAAPSTTGIAALTASATPGIEKQTITCGDYTIGFDTDAGAPNSTIFIGTGTEVNFVPTIFRTSDGTVPRIVSIVWLFPDEPGENITTDTDGNPVITVPEEGPTPMGAPGNPSNFPANQVPHTYENPGTFPLGLRVFIQDTVTGESGWCPGPIGVGLPIVFPGAINVTDTADTNSADFNIEDLVIDQTALVPANDWVPLVQFTMSFAVDSPAPRVLDRLTFELVGAQLAPHDFLEFGFFRDRGGPNGEPDGSFDNLKWQAGENVNDFPLRDSPTPDFTIDAKGFPLDESSSNDDTFYDFKFLDIAPNQVGTPRGGVAFTAAPGDGNGWIMAVRTSSAWEAGDTLGIRVLNAIMLPIIPPTPVFDEFGNIIEVLPERLGTPFPDDSYSPDFSEGPLDSGARYLSSSFAVVDTRSPREAETRFNQWNWPIYQYTPRAEFNRFRFNATGLTLQSVLGEIVDIRDLISVESWAPVLAIDVHGTPSGNLLPQPREVNLVLTDIGADPFGPPGNGGFDPRNGRMNNFTSNVLFVGSDGNRAAGDDHVFNGVGLFFDANNDGIFQPPTPDGQFGVTVSGSDLPLYLDNRTDTDFVTPGLLEWEYVPFPPGGGDPWWRIKMIYDRGGRPGSPAGDNVAGTMEATPDFFPATEVPIPDYFIAIRPDSGFRDQSGETGDGTAIGLGAEMRAFIEPRRWNPQDGGHWDGGIRLSNSYAGREIVVSNSGNVNFSQLPFWQDDTRLDAICPEGVFPCPSQDQVTRTYSWWPERTHNQTTVKPVKIGIDVHDLVLTYSTNNRYAKVTDIRELQGRFGLADISGLDDVTDFSLPLFTGFQDTPSIFSSIDYGNGLAQDFFGIMELNFFRWQNPFIIGDLIFGPDDLYLPEHYAYETVPFRLDATAIDPQLREPRSVFFTQPFQQPTLPDITTWPPFELAEAFGFSSYCYLESEGDIPNEPFLPAQSNISESTYEDDVYVFVAEDCNNCGGVTPGMWLIDRYGARYPITAVSGNRFTLDKGHAAYMDRQFRFNNNELDLEDYPFNIQVGENFAIRRGNWMVVADAIQRTQYARQQDWPAGLESDGGARAARILKQKVEVNSQPTAMLGINLVGVDDAVVNASETISLNSITVAFWGPEFDRSDLAQLDPSGVLASSGVLLYEDSTGNGVFDGPIVEPLTGTVLVNGDRIVPLEAGSLEWRATGAEPIDLDGDFEADDLSGDGFVVLSQAEREALLDNPAYDGLLDLAWVLRLEPAAKWTVPFTDPVDNEFGDFLQKSNSPLMQWNSFWTKSPTLIDLADLTVERLDKALPNAGSPGDDLFVVVRTSNSISAFEQFRAVIPSKLPTRTPDSERVAAIEMSPITYPVVDSFRKTDPEEGVVQSFYAHDMLEASVPARIIDLSTGLIPGAGVAAPVIEPGSAPAAVLGLDLSANRPANLIGAGTTGSQISNGYTTASFTTTPTTEFYDSGWTDEVVGLYLIATSEAGAGGFESRIEAYEITAVSNNDLTLRAGQPRVGSAWFVVKDPTFLEQVVVEFFDEDLDGAFDPQRDLLPLNFEDPANGFASGVSLYRDNDFHPSNRNGVFDPPVLDASGNIIEYIDLPVRLDQVPAFVGVPGEPEYQVRMVFSTPGTDELQGRTTVAYEDQTRNRQWIPQTFGLGSADPNTGSDFFVVLRTSRDMNEGDDFRVGIASWGPNTPSLPDPDNFNPSLSSSELPGQRPDEFDIFDEFPWGNRGLGFITFFRDPPPVYYWGYDHVNKRDIAVQEVDRSQDDRDIRYWVRSHPVASGATFPITALPAPVIDFTADRNRQIPGGTVQFTLISNGGVSAVSWNFGDGGTSTERNPAHVYENAGFYTVSVTVTNAFGVSDTVTKPNYIEITPAPFADFTASPLDGAITPDPNGVLPPGLNVSFIDRSQGTPDLVPIRYFWEFGDGQTLTTTARATEESPLVHRYLQEGFYTVSLEVTFQNPVTQATQVSICEQVGLITVRPCIGCPGSGEGEGEGSTEAEGGEDPPAANFEITSLIRDKEALVPLHDWMPLANFVLGFGEDENAPRILRTLSFQLRPDTREPDAFGIANINGPQITDILEFGIFQETYDSNDEKNNLLDNDFDFLLYTFDATGAPLGTVDPGISDLIYRLNFVGNGTAADPDFPIEAAPEADDSLNGNSYILAVRTSATWRSATTMGITVFDAQMIDPRNGQFPVNDEGEPIDSYSPNFFEDEELNEEAAYSASFSVWDTTGNQFDGVQFGGSEVFGGSPYNFWNQNVFLYTPLVEHSRPLWNSLDRLFELTAGEVLEMRQLISSEQWVPVLALNLHSASPVHTEFINGSNNTRQFIVEDHAQLKEVNLVFTDIGGDPLGAPGNGGFNPREHLDTMTNENWSIYEPTFARDQTFNGAWVWSDTNGNGRFDAAVPDPVFNGVNFPGDRPLYASEALSSWEYIPFPPGGGDPWWKITLRFFGGEQRPSSEEGFAGYLDAVPDNIFGDLNGASEVTFDYFVTVRADSGFQDVSLAPGDNSGIPAGADFRVFVEPRRFDTSTGSQTGGIYVDSMTPVEGIVTNGVSIFSTWQDDPRWLEEEPWWPERTHNAKTVKPIRYGLEVHDLVLTYQSDSTFANETFINFGFGPFWDAGCLTYAIPGGGQTDFDAWNDPFQLQQSKFLNQHSVGVTRWRFFGTQFFNFPPPIGAFSYSYDESNSSSQFAYETVPFFSNDLTNGDNPPVGPRSTAFSVPPAQPALPDYSTWPAFQRPGEYQRASDWAAEDNRARMLTQQAETNSVHTAMLGINVTGADDPVVNSAEGPTIGKLSVAFWGPNFNPSDLAPLDSTGQSTLSGVLLWEDSDLNGVFADTEIFRQYAEGLPSGINLDSIVPLQGLRWPSSPELIDLNGNGEPDDMNGDGVVDDRDRAWVLDLTPATLWPVPRRDGASGGFGSVFNLIFCSNADFSKSGVQPPFRHASEVNFGETGDKVLDATVTQPGDDLFITIRTSDTGSRFEQIRAVVPATLPQREEGQRLAGIQFFPQFNSSPSAFVKSNPDEDPVQDFYGHDALKIGVPVKLIDLTDQNSALVVGGPAVAPWGLDASTNVGRNLGTLDTGTSGIPSDRTFQVTGKAWTEGAFVKDFLVDKNYESFEIVGNSGDTLDLRSGTPADGRWRIVRNPTFLETVTIEFYNEGTDADFNITTDLLPLKLDQELSGVALYRDNDNDPRNRNGIFDVNIDIPIKLDVPPALVGQAGEATQVQFVFSTPGTDNVPLPLEQQTRHRQWIYDTYGSVASDAEFGPDFFVVIRASETMRAGDNFRMGIVGYGPITPTEPDPDTFARISGEARNDFAKFREFPWAKRALGFVTFFKEPQVSYFMDADRAGQKVDNSGFDWLRSHSNRKKRSGVVTASNRTVSPRSVVIEGASETQLPSQTLPGAPFSLVLNGRGFGTSPVVVLSGYEVSIQGATDTQISLRIETLEGDVPTEPIVVIVRNPSTGEEASRSDLFRLTAGTGQRAPDIVSLTPNAGGDESFPVVIRGTNFPALEDAFVQFGSTRMPVLSASPDGTSLTVGFPAGGLPSTGPLNVTVRDLRTGLQDVLINGFNYSNGVQRSKTGLFSCAPQAAESTGLAGDMALVLGIVALLSLASLRRRARQ